MGLLKHQADISAPVALPVESVSSSSSVGTATSETVTWQYSNSGVWASATGQAAGTVVMGKLAYDRVRNSAGTTIGTYNDTSLSWGAATRAATKVTVPEDVLSRMAFMSVADQVATVTPYLATAGDYAIDHRRGVVWLKSKAQVANDAATYKYAAAAGGGAVTVADGGDVTLGAKADAKSTATDTTAVTIMQVLKQISYMEQNPASRAVTFTTPTSQKGPADPVIDSYANAAISAAANTADQSLIAAPGANKQIWVYGINYSVGTADGSVSFQDEDNTAISGVMPFANKGGMVVSPSGNFSMPLWKVATNKALECDTVSCDIKGSVQYAIVSV